jgi:hypothetical protein
MILNMTLAKWWAVRLLCRQLQPVGGRHVGDQGSLPVVDIRLKRSSMGSGVSCPAASQAGVTAALSWLTSATMCQ